jgi:hypothetical protein
MSSTDLPCAARSLSRTRRPRTPLRVPRVPARAWAVAKLGWEAPLEAFERFYDSLLACPEFALE